MKLNKLAKGVLAASALMAAGFAQADIIASSRLSVDDFRLIVNGGSASTPTQTWSLVNDATFNGVTASQQSVNALTGIGPGEAEGDPASVCSGPDCNVFAENDYATSLTFGMGDFASSDSYVYTNSNIGPDFGTDADSRADASMNASSSNLLQNASSNIQNSITSEITFGLDDGSDENEISLSYSFIAELITKIDSDMIMNGVNSVANASFNLDFTLLYDANDDGNFDGSDGTFGGIGGANFLNMVAFGESEGKSADNEAGAAETYNDTKFLTLSGMNSGEYKLIIVHSTIANVKSVDEPGLLGIFSLGLLGLAGLARRRAK